MNTDNTKQVDLSSGVLTYEDQVNILMLGLRSKKVITLDNYMHARALVRNMNVTNESKTALILTEGWKHNRLSLSAFMGSITKWCLKNSPPIITEEDAEEILFDAIVPSDYTENKTKIIIELNGGLVQRVTTSDFETEFDIEVVDHDIEDIPEQEDEIEEARLRGEEIDLQIEEGKLKEIR